MFMDQTRPQKDPTSRGGGMFYLLPINGSGWNWRAYGYKHLVQNGTVKQLFQRRRADAVCPAITIMRPYVVRTTSR